MLDIDEIEHEIDSLENGRTTYSAVEKLATLYSIRDHYRNDSVQFTARQLSVSVNPSSDFINAFNAVDIGYALSVIDSHMESVKLLYPREYDSVLRKLQEGQV